MSENKDEEKIFPPKTTTTKTKTKSKTKLSRKIKKKKGKRRRRGRRERSWRISYRRRKKRSPLSSSRGQFDQKILDGKGWKGGRRKGGQKGEREKGGGKGCTSWRDVISLRF